MPSVNFAQFLASPEFDKKRLSKKQSCWGWFSIGASLPTHSSSHRGRKFRFMASDRPSVSNFGVTDGLPTIRPEL